MSMQETPSAVAMPPADRGRAGQWTWSEGRDGGSAQDGLAGRAGVVSAAQLFRTDGWLHPDLKVWMVSSGDIEVARGARRIRPHDPVISTGRVWKDDAHSRMIAICEGLERYCSLVYDWTEFTLARVDDLGPHAMSFHQIAQFSAAEITRSGGLLRRPPRTRAIRWYEGVDLYTAHPAWLPAAMTFIVAELMDAERFWLPFSTGAAIHQTTEAALVAAICEIVERDAAALCWLQKLPPPLLDPVVLLPSTKQLVDWFADRGIRTLLFDITTDLGIPTVWCLQLCETADHTDRLAQVCATATALDPSDAAHKAVVECTSGREILHELPTPPARYAEYADVTEGAIHMARRSRRRAFAFLIENLKNRRISPGRTVPGTTPADQLGYLLEILERHDQPAYAADLTTREITQAGLVAVRVILPRLLPMSVQPRASYRGTPRLYQAPANMGYPPRSESRLNPYPVPLA
jgi:ribosomal protein S12 methylthiotransferase accessory factor